MISQPQPPSNQVRVIQSIGLTLTAWCVIALAISITTASAVPIARAAPNRSNLLQSQPTITTYVYLPLVRYTSSEMVVDPHNRQASLEFYQEHYLGWEGASPDWDGDHNSCNPGTTSAGFRAAVLHRINYFRAMAGLPAKVIFNDTYTAKAQAAALMMSVNDDLSHDPPTSWQCYSDAGHEGAGNSNLYLGTYGWAAITGYMLDPGNGNYFVGHRRWILYPQTQEMGTGDIPPVNGHSPSNALWVFDGNWGGPRPTTREEFVAWPPPGYVPYQVVFARWSLAYPNADFSTATVTMSSDGSSVPVAQAPVVNGYGENTLVWIPNGTNSSASWPQPTGDTAYTVNVQNVKINGQNRNFTYDVIVFDPTP